MSQLSKYKRLINAAREKYGTSSAGLAPKKIQKKAKTKAKAKPKKKSKRTSPQPRKTLKSIKNRHQGQNFLVIGAGKSIVDHHDDIESFIKKHNCQTIGINNMAHLFTPHYHLWTNNKRWRDFGDCVKNESTLLLGRNISKHRTNRINNSIVIDFVDKEGHDFSITDDQICGRFRTAGVMAIAISHIMGARNIYIVGMDGFTLHRRDELLNQEYSQHCYGEGYTDDADWEECTIKDKLVQAALEEIDRYGIKFGIITPTKFNTFYKEGLLTTE